MIVEKIKITENEIKKLVSKFNPFYKILNFEKFENFNLNLKLPKKYYYKNILFLGTLFIQYIHWLDRVLICRLEI